MLEWRLRMSRSHFSLIRKERTQTKSALRRTVNAYLIMIHWLFQDHLSQKMRERNRWPIFIALIIPVLSRHRSLVLLLLPVFFHLFVFSIGIVTLWFTPGLLRLKPNPLLSSGNQPDTDLSGRLMGVKPRLTVSTVSCGCDSRQRADAQMH